MKKGLLSIFALAVLMMVSAIGHAQTTYTKVTSASGLEAGAQYLIVGFEEDGSAYAMSYQKSNNRHAVLVSESSGVITVTVATDPSSQNEPDEFTLGGSNGAWTFFDPLKEGYLYAPGGGNYLKTQTELTDNGKWNLVLEADGACVPESNGDVEQRFMHYNPNNGTPLFGSYKETSNVSAPVYLFKAGGAAEPDPEPSNYPTDFTAEVDMVNVTLTWTDATGSQLPAKYLVLASTGNITVPTDGVPVENSALAINVGYGVQTVTFNNLNGNTTYHFAIFPYTNSGANIDYKTGSGYPTANATTEDVYVLLSEDFEEDMGAFTAVNLYGDQEWHHTTYNGNGYAYMNGYASGAAHQNEDWLISPALSGDYQVIELSFETAMNYEGDDLRVAVSSDYDGVSEPGDFEWELLTDLFDWSSGSYTWVESGTHNIKPFVGSTFYIAFIYTCSDAGAAAWQVDNVNVVAQSPVNVAEQVAKTFAVSPNPANGAIHFELSQQAQVSVFDLSGRMVSENRMSAGASTLEVANLENGIYFLSVIYQDGTKEVARFVKF